MMRDRYRPASEMGSSGHRHSVLRAAAMYVAAVFALGFIFGVARSLLIDDSNAASRLHAVLVEAPLLLIAAWYLCRWSIARHAVPPVWQARATMGALALGWLLAAELGIGLFLAGRTLVEHLGLYAQPSYAVGLAAQVVFACFPALQIRFAPAPR